MTANGASEGNPAAGLRGGDLPGASQPGQSGRLSDPLDAGEAGQASHHPSDQPVPLRRNQDFLLLWSGQAVSVLGSQVSRIAYPLLVLAMTGSPAKAGLAGFAATLPYLLFPLLAGGLVDRLDRKRLMIGCDAVRLAAVGSIT